MQTRRQTTAESLRDSGSPVTPGSKHGTTPRGTTTVDEDKNPLTRAGRVSHGHSPEPENLAIKLELLRAQEAERQQQHKERQEERKRSELALQREHKERERSE